MRGFELVTPASLCAAIALLDTDDPTVRAFSGGTALMLMMKTGVFAPSRLVNLAAIEPRFGTIEATPDGGLRIGAMATLTTVEHSPEVIRIAPVIAKAMKHLANVRVRNVARVGGNLAHGDPHMDLPPILAALGGEVCATGPAGERTIPVDGLFSGYYETVLGQGELITGVTLPSQDAWRSAYLKCTTRTADDWPALGVAASVKVAGDTITDVRLMVSAATEKLTRLHAAEASLRGGPADAAAFVRAGEAAMAEAETIGDSRGSASYKAALVRVHVGRALEAAMRNGKLQ